MTTKLTNPAQVVLYALADAAGGKTALASYLYEGISTSNPRILWESLRLAAKAGHIVRHVKDRAQALGKVHGVDVPDDVFLTKKQREAA